MISHQNGLALPSPCTGGSACMGSAWGLSLWFPSQPQELSGPRVCLCISDAADAGLCSPLQPRRLAANKCFRNFFFCIFLVFTTFLGVEKGHVLFTDVEKSWAAFCGRRPAACGTSALSLPRGCAALPTASRGHVPRRFELDCP